MNLTTPPDGGGHGGNARHLGATSRSTDEEGNAKADVIFAFFGYNESFAGEGGLPKFKIDLDDWIKHTLAQK